MGGGMVLKNAKSKIDLPKVMSTNIKKMWFGQNLLKFTYLYLCSNILIIKYRAFLKSMQSTSKILP